MIDYKQLTLQAQNGSSESAYVLFLSTLKQVFYTVLKKTENDERSKYVVRDAYIQAFKNIQKLEHPEVFPVWVQAFSVSVADEYIRRRKTVTGRVDNPVGQGPWDQKECDSFEIEESLAKEIWAGVLFGVAGKPVESAVAAGPAEGRPDADEVITLDGSKVEALLTQVSMEKAKARRRRKFIFAAVVLCIAVVAGAVTVGWNKTHKSRRMTGIGSLYNNVSDAKVLKFASALSRQLAGQIGEIYEMSDNTYYVVIYLNNEASGGALVSFEGADDSDEASFKIISKTDRVLSDEEIEALSDDQYMRVDYSASKRTNANAIEDAINAAGEGELEADGNSVMIDEGVLDEIISKSDAEKEKLSGIFGIDDPDEALNVMLTVRCRHVDMTRPVRLVLDESVAQMIGEGGQLQIVLNDDRHCIRLSGKQLEKLCSEYGSVTVNIQAENNRIYNIAFAGPDGRETEQLYGDMEFVFPADSSLTYVYASYRGGQSYAEGSENRGGTYDEKSGTIVFPVSRSGRYELIGDETELFDISGLEEETKNACEFAASMEFIPAGTDGNFRPNQNMTREGFVEALGKMFFSTDKSKTVDFTDVEKGDEVYDFVAAGFAENVVKGLSDGSFGGSRVITREELLTMAGKTLVYKGYGAGAEATGSNGADAGENSVGKAGEKTAVKLNYEDRNQISKFARESIQVAADCGLIPADGKLEPQNPATRAWAAVILYRMYELIF